MATASFFRSLWQPIGAIVVAVVALALFSAMPDVEAGPDPCPPLDANVLFFDCFDLGTADTNGGDDLDGSLTVDSSNEGAWVQSETTLSSCVITAEEMALHRFFSLADLICNSVTSPLVTFSGFSEVTVRFEWGGTSDTSSTFGALLSEDGGTFESVDTIILPVINSCDTVNGGNCADNTFTSTAEFEDCGEHTLQLQLTGPTAATSHSIAYVDDVRFVGTACVDAAAAVTVTKACLGAGFDATFDISIGDQTESVACGQSTTLVDATAGDYTISETIGGPDAGGFTTAIVCEDGEVILGTSTSVAIPAEGAEDVSCVLINDFTGGGLTEEEVTQLLLSLNLDLDLEAEIEHELNNVNSNVSDNDNTNENNNTNENTQNQTNDQNTNVTTGDVNVSSGGGAGTGTGSAGVGDIKIIAPNTGSGGLVDASSNSGPSTAMPAAAVGLLAALSLAAVKLSGISREFSQESPCWRGSFLIGRAPLCFRADASRSSNRVMSCRRSSKSARCSSK